MNAPRLWMVGRRGVKWRRTAKQGSTTRDMYCYSLWPASRSSRSSQRASARSLTHNCTLSTPEFAPIGSRYLPVQRNSPSQLTYGSVRLHHAPGGQGGAPQARHPQGHLAVLLPRRQDRRAGAERLGQVQPAQDHGGRGQGHRGRGDPDAQHAHRLPAAGTSARPRSRRCARRSRRAWARSSKPSKKLDEIYAAYAEPDADFDKLATEQAKYEAILAASGSDVEHQLEIAADALRLPPWDAKIANLSGGEKRRVALCRLLLSKPDMLLLDEPTNHLDAESVDWLEQFLQKFPGTVVAVTHDRYFLDNAAQWILELDRGHGIPWKGNYSSWLEQKEQRLEIEAKQEVRAHQGHEEGARVGALQPQGAAGQEQGAHRALRGAELLRAARSATRRRRSSSRWPSAWATASSSSRTCRRATASAC